MLWLIELFFIPQISRRPFTRFQHISFISTKVQWWPVFGSSVWLPCTNIYFYDGHVTTQSKFHRCISYSVKATLHFLEFSNKQQYVAFHLLSKLFSECFQEYIGPLLEAVKKRDRAQALEWKQSEHWATVEQLVMASGGGAAVLGGSGEAAAAGSSAQSSSSSTSWTCQHCTFINQTASENCEMCHLPRWIDSH